MRTFYIVAIILLAAPAAPAQELVLSGSVQHAITKEWLGGCTVAPLHGKTAARTDSRGRFNLSLSRGAGDTLLISCTGYASDTVLPGQDAAPLLIQLRPAPESLSEVVITGVSRAMLIRENPVAIAAVSAKNIDVAVEANIIDALVKYTPGMTAVKTGPNISKPFIRGLGYNRVLTLYDGMRQEGQQWGDEHSVEVDAYNIARAEIIKGPASLMFGSDALAGVVSLYPHMPATKDSVLHGRVVSEYQHNNGLLGNGFRLGRHGTHWIWSARGSYRIAKNYTNNVDDRVYNTGFREANAALMVGYRLANGYTHLNATAYDNLQGIPDGSRDSLTRKFTRQEYEGALDDITQRPIVSDAVLNSYTLSPLHQHIQHYRLYTNNHYRLGRGEIDASLGFQQNTRREYSHPTNPRQAALFVRLNTINYGIKYLLPAFNNIELTAGANGMYQHNKSKAATDFPIPNYSLLDIGGYVYGKWKYRQLTVSGGVRYDTRRLRGPDFYVRTGTSGFDQQVSLPDTAGARRPFPAFGKNFNGSSVSLGLAYQMTNTISIKANIARGYRSPNITEFASNGLDPGAHIIYLGNRSFVPEFSFQQDLGILINNKHWQFTASIFNNDIQHYIYLTQLVDGAGNPVVDAQGNRTFQYQQGAAHLYGAESSLDIHPAAWKGFSAISSLSVTYGTNRQKELAGTKNGGEYLPLIPPLKWVSSISQEFYTGRPLLPSFFLKTEWEYNAAQHRYLGLFNTETFTQAWSLFNAAAGTQINYSKTNYLQLQLQVNNLFDLAYQSHLSRLKYFEYYSASPTGRTGMYNMGRNICIKLIAAF
jgi:iron complex outermembrane recepter protein